MSAIKNKFLSFEASRKNGKTSYVTREDRVVENIELIDPALGGKLIVRTKTLPNGNSIYRRQNLFPFCKRL